jgi:hypothetical protein
MQKIVSVVMAIIPLIIASGEELVPTADGTTWLYQMTQEAGKEFSFSDAKPGPDGKVHRLATYRITGAQEVDGKILLKFEMIRDGVITNTDLMTVDEHGISCAARVDQYGELTKLEPAQTIIAAPLKPGASWEFDGKVADTNVRQHYDVLPEENVDLPAGKFRASHIHGEQTSPMRMTIDRWFVNGTGIVKDVTTIKMPDGDLLRRISLELKERPKIAPRPKVKSVPPPKKISVTVGKALTGASTDQFRADTPKIYARWHGRGLRVGAKIRVVWIAENVTDIPPDHTIDEATTTANSPDAHGIFTLARPDTGWVPGNYRVDFYLDAELADKAKLKIVR